MSDGVIEDKGMNLSKIGHVRDSVSVNDSDSESMNLSESAGECE